MNVQVLQLLESEREQGTPPQLRHGESHGRLPSGGGGADPDVVVGSHYQDYGVGSTVSSSGRSDTRASGSKHGSMSPSGDPSVTSAPTSTVSRVGGRENVHY